MEPPYHLPDGRYTMLNASIRLTYGGATRSQLLRARLFSENTGLPVELATFDAYPEYDTERELLTSKGLLPPQVHLRNMYEEFAVSSDLGRFSDGTDMEVPSWFQESLDRDFTVEYAKDGRPWRRAIDVNGDRRSFYFQYLRSDGSVYATVDRRIGGSDWDRQNRGVVLTDPVGTPVAVFGSIPELINSWIRVMGERDKRHFLIFDSKESGRLIAEQPREDNQFLILTAHTPHLQPPRHWNSPAATADWQETISGLRHWDAFIVLSDAHRADLELAEGKLNNIFVLPHPIAETSPSASDDRNPNLALIVCRLEKQKRIQDALHAFRRVVDEVPAARLEIYGEGSKRAEWEDLTRSLGLSDSVEFLGYDPNPGRQYRRASVFLMTSLFEAQPLSLLEAISHGSPIVAYDIKYGPAQMVRHGSNGFLTREGDIDDFARRTISLLSDPTLSSRMSQASFEMSENFQLPRFFAAWNELLETICQQKESRLELKQVSAELDGDFLPPGRGFSNLTTLEMPDKLHITGRIAVRTQPRRLYNDAQPNIQLRVHHPRNPNVLYLETADLPGVSDDERNLTALLRRSALEEVFPDHTTGFELWCEITLSNAHSLFRCDPSSAAPSGNALPEAHRSDEAPVVAAIEGAEKPGQDARSAATFHVDLTADVAEAFERHGTDRPNFIHVHDVKGKVGDRGILKAAHQNSGIRETVNALAQRGYYVYHTTDGVSKFVKDEHIPKMWHSVLNGTYSVSDEDIVHIVEEPGAGVPPRKLIVVFSSIGDIFNEGLFRYFTRNYQSIRKFVPQDVAILRIADIGGVVGGFYLNTTYRPDNAERISSLIENKRLQLGLTKDDVITYGASKGATGALFHAVTNGYKSVSVEPIVNDHYYETAFGDTHFTSGGNFPATKEFVFGSLIQEHKNRLMAKSAVSSPRIAVIYSEQSPQFPYITELLAHNAPSDITLVNVTHPGIKDHPDVSPASLNLTATFLNMLCYGFTMPAGHFSLRCE
ncbi:hypothetical protein CVO76_13205 [Arthrobacter agilis]|uniref:Glycosyl transferase family 1 domain-containing protein n=1 Tax=Arthrobacter agilis TaxID=37921 RepID=A0A2L0UGW9_9MICC|nr:XcbB/CpsF family capsular polysaccharide biosynthesis protein [Arthrobacter agilis]AUZ88490.1 hypothetical protein CVO76_13205 [Arthrobacter agilis]